MSYKPTPITAKILKTTKGGVTQPILNMGADVTVSALTMKAPSPNKQGGRKRIKKTPTPSEPRAKASNPRIKNSRQDIAHRAIANANKARVGSKPPFQAPTSGKSENRMFFTPGGEDTVIAQNSKKIKTTKKAKAAGNAKGKLKPGEGVLKNPPKSTAGNFEPANPKNSNPVPWAFRQDKKIGGGSHSGVKGKMGSDTRKAEYDKKGWAYDETISKASVEKAKPRAKVKAVNTIKAKKGVDIKKARTTSLETKLDPKTLQTQAAKEKSKPSKGDVRKANRKLDSADRKDRRAAKARQKGIDALASGDKKKSLRLKKREIRIKDRANKKRGQAASAIRPK